MSVDSRAGRLALAGIVAPRGHERTAAPAARTTCAQTDSWEQRRPEVLPLAGMALTLGFVLLALAGPRLAPFDPALAVAKPLLAPSTQHLFGTNDIGQDLFSQWLTGSRASLLIAAAVTLLSAGLAWLVGIASCLGSAAGAPLIALTDVLLALPPLPLYMLVVALLGPSRPALIVTLGLLSWPAYARVVRARVLVLLTSGYVESARAMGATNRRVAMRHILPGTLNLLPAMLLHIVRFAILAEVTLAFLGLGDPALKSWGSVLGAAFGYPLVFTRGIWQYWMLPPAASIALLVLAVTWTVTGFERR